MSRRETISPAALQARARRAGAERALARLAGRSGAGPSLDETLRSLEGIGPVALATLIQRFGLTALQTDIFLLCAGPELDPEAALALAEHPLAQKGRPTPALIEVILGPEALQELSAAAVLRQGMLVTLEPGAGFAHRALSLPEAVATALNGSIQPDPALAPAMTLIDPVPGIEPPETLARAVVAARETHPRPVLHLDIDDPVCAAQLAATAFAALGLSCYGLDPAFLPDGLGPTQVAQRLNRDLVLLEAGLLVPAGAEGCQIADRTAAPLMIWGRTPARTDRPRASFRADVLDPTTDRLIADTFRLAPVDMRDVETTHAMGFGPDLWSLARSRAGHALDGLAERIEPQARWQDLVLPEAQMRQLHQLAAYRSHREQVLGGWGFREKSARGLGLSALFSGISGTGKTMAAEILARELGGADGALDLFRVDLSSIISKYIGETEKNIGRIFDAAERAGAILIFDEGEALFGKRSSDVKDSLDRHANSETAYLLQRLEAFTGIAIVTTNLKGTVDDAFLRRFRAVVDFPFPDSVHRKRIWQSVFPDALPLEGIDYDALARLAISGGFIRSIALTAAFMAADAGTPVTMALLRRAARQEYGKLGKTLSETELRGLK